MRQVGKVRIVLPVIGAMVMPVQAWCRPPAFVPAAAPMPDTTAPRRPAPEMITSSNSRELGSFGSESEAISAAHQANLGPGTYGLATIGDERVAISSSGSVYDSGTAQRPPRNWPSNNK